MIPAIIKLRERVERIEAILRHNKLHEPGCPADHDCHKLGCGVYHVPQPCTCWLSEDPATAKKYPPPSWPMENQT